MADIALEDLTDVDGSQRSDGAVLTYNAARRIWQATTQSTSVTRADLDAAIATALATLRVQ